MKITIKGVDRVGHDADTRPYTYARGDENALRAEKAAWVLELIAAAEAAVYIADPSMPGKMIVGLRLDRDTQPLAQALSTFNLLVDLAEIQARESRMG